MVFGGAVLIETGLRIITSPPHSAGFVVCAGGIAMAFAGLLTFARRRSTLVRQLLSVVAAGTWALALTFLSRGNADEVADSLLQLAVWAAGFLLVTIVFEDAFSEAPGIGAERD
jgi:hypothetical protein